MNPFMDALKRPTLKQKEAYGRLAHTLCAASLVAGSSLMGWRATPLDKVLLLYGLGVLLFFLGAVLSKGE